MMCLFRQCAASQVLVYVKLLSSNIDTGLELFSLLVC